MKPARTPEKLQQVVRNLKIGDLILVHTKKDPISSLIRLTTESYWTHVALVFDVPHTIAKGVSLDEVLIVETAPGEPLAVHRLQHYLTQPDKYDLGFKRMPGMSDEERERFRGFFLEVLDTPYDLFRVFLMFAQMVYTWIAKVNVSFRAAGQMITTRRYICTTFAQRAYYLAVAPHKRHLVLFRGHEHDIGFLEQMEKITPATIASSPNTVWLHNPHR